jgi:hypothetical protein
VDLVVLEEHPLSAASRVAEIWIGGWLAWSA